MDFSVFLPIILLLFPFYSCKTIDSNLYSDQANKINSSGEQCKCLPGNKCWTTMVKDLENLKPRLSSSEVLINSFEISELEKCKPDFSSPGCEIWVEKEKKPFMTPYYIQDKSWASMHAGLYNGWEYTASQYTIGAKSVKDVSEGIKFAEKHNLKLVVKSGGHDYLGRSQAADSLLIWTHHMRNISFNQAKDDTTTCNKEHTISVEAGARWAEVYDYLLEGEGRRKGRYLPGGAEKSVGVAGFTLGGGMSFYAKKLGPTAGFLVSMEIVTPNGEVRTVSACSKKQEDQDLFFALRGAGAGSFGVVTKFTFETIDASTLNPGIAWFTAATRNESAYKKLIKLWLEFYRDNLNNEHFGNIVDFMRIPLPAKEEEAHTSVPDDMNGFVGLVMAPSGLHYDGMNVDQLKEILDRFKSKALNIPGVLFPKQPQLPENPTISPPLTIREFRKKLLTLDPNYGLEFGSAGEQGLRATFAAYDSLWVPSRFLEGEDVNQLANAISDATKQWSLQMHISKGMHITGKDKNNLSPAQIRTQNTSMNPQILDSSIQIISSYLTPSFNPNKENLSLMSQRVKAAMDLIRSVVGEESGTYINESNYFDKKWQNNNYGSHYSRLLKIKKAVDPNDLFICHHCVGSEKWNKEGTCRI